MGINAKNVEKISHCHVTRSKDSSPNFIAINAIHLDLKATHVNTVNRRDCVQNTFHLNDIKLSARSVSKVRI